MWGFQDIDMQRLSNGLLVITEKIPRVKSVCVDFWVNVGSRDESTALEGCSHFLEHLVSKSSKKRTEEEIFRSIESKGGYLNGETDRSMTRHFAYVLKDDMDLAVDVIADMIQNPLLKEEAIESERKVVLEEIASEKDNPEAVIDNFSVDTVWNGTQAAHNVLGKGENICNMTRDQILEYFQKHYVPRRIVVSAAGNLDHDKLLESVELYYESDSTGNGQEHDKPIYAAKHGFLEKDLEQVQLCLVAEGVGYDTDEKTALDLIKTYLTSGLSSVLYQELAAKRGLLYDIHADNYCLKDAGLFRIFAGVSMNHAEEVLRISLQQLERLKSGIETKKLIETKRKFIGSLILNFESTEERSYRLGTTSLMLGKPKTIQEEIEDIESVTSEQIAQAAERVFDRNKLTITAVGVTKKQFGVLTNCVG